MLLKKVLRFVASFFFFGLFSDVLSYQMKHRYVIQNNKQSKKSILLQKFIFKY